jgi:hypothetical protein
VGEAELVPTSVKKYAERYSRARVFVRAVESERYTLTEQQRELRASVPRLIRPKLGLGTSERWNIMQPGDESFRSQSLRSISNTRPSTSAKTLPQGAPAAPSCASALTIDSTLVLRLDGCHHWP